MSRLTRDGTAEPVSRDQILRHARGRGNIIFPVQLTTSRIGNLTRLIHTLLYVMKIIFPCPRACPKIWSRETDSAAPSRVNLLIPYSQAESGAYLRDSSRVPRRRPFMKSPYAIGSVPSLSGHAIAYRWRALPRVRRRRAKPQGGSERVLPWQITMDQLIFASLSHTHYWYEVGMLKVPAE